MHHGVVVVVVPVPELFDEAALVELFLDEPLDNLEMRLTKSTPKPIR